MTSGNGMVVRERIVTMDEGVRRLVYAATLGLATTSAHPRIAGLQNDLADLLLERGTRIGPASVRCGGCAGCGRATISPDRG